MILMHATSTDPYLMTYSMSQRQSKFDIVFAEGLRRHERKTGQRLDSSNFAKLATVADVRSYVEQENSKFATFRDQNSKIYERLTTAFTPIEKLGSIVAAGSSAGFPPAGACFGAVALLIKAAQNVSAHYDHIVELFDILAVR
jgi:hypothetical protein